MLIHIPKTGGTSLILAGVPGGHHVEYKGQGKYMVILREPVSRTISHYAEQLKEPLKIWFQRYHMENFQTNWLRKKLHVNTLGEIKSILKKDFTILTTNTLTEQMKKLGINIEKRNIGRGYIPTKEEISFIEERSGEDIELYQWVCDHISV